MYSFYSTSKCKVLLAILALATSSVYAQNNYVATSPSSANPGTNNTIVGIGSGQSAGSGVNNNTFVGYQSGNKSVSGAINNTFIGTQSGYNNTTGNANVFIGSLSGYNNTTGVGNMFLGQQSGSNNATGSYNLFFGNSSGNSNTTGTGNTSMGDGSGYGWTTGSNNTAVGRYAGMNNTTGSNNTYIGVAAGPPSGSSNNNLTYATAIGTEAVVTKSNSLILGKTGTSVGIGNTAPNNRLEITAATANASGLRFTNLTQSTNVLSVSLSVANPVFKTLTVNPSGDVVLQGIDINLVPILNSVLPGVLNTVLPGTLNTILPGILNTMLPNLVRAILLGGLREGVGVNEGFGLSVAGAAGEWKTTEGFTRNTSLKGVIIGDGVTKTSSDYSLFVSKGILTEKVKVAVANSSEWADYVFAKDYKLRSLAEVERFVKENKHLPGVPSAADVVENGVDVGKMDAKLLEKIEELTLYMIELKKENQQMKKAIRTLSQAKRK